MSFESSENQNELLIDNGEDRILLDKARISRELTYLGVSSESITLMMGAVDTYANEVKEELQHGVHVGSTDLGSGINSIFYEQGGEVDPAKYGFATEIELKLAAKLVELHCKKA